MFFETFDSFARHVRKGPFLGLDWGKKRIGLALSDPENRVAAPLLVVHNHAVYGALTQLRQDHKPSALIIGFPIHMDGRESLMCQKIRKFAKTLEEAFDICFWDERLTTQGLKSLSPFGVKRDQVDAHAAAFMLQGALSRWTQWVAS